MYLIQCLVKQKYCPPNSYFNQSKLNKEFAFKVNVQFYRTKCEIYRILITMLLRGIAFNDTHLCTIAETDCIKLQQNKFLPHKHLTLEQT